MKKIEIELDGVKVGAVLREDKAPKTCASFWNGLEKEYEDRAETVVCSGEVFHLLSRAPVDDETIDSFQHPYFPGIEYKGPLKNSIGAGDVVFYPRTKEIMIGYGQGKFGPGPAHSLHITFLASIDKTDPNYDEFMKKAASVHTEGLKKIVFRRKEA